MRINFNRLSRLAGLPTDNNRKSLYEGKDHEDASEKMSYEGTALEGMDVLEDDEKGEGMMYEEEHEDASETMYEEEHEEGMDPENEMMEVDEVMLVQELRRAKRIMQENKRASLNESRRRQIFEKQLKQVIDEEVSNVMDEMNLTAGWVYGNNKPRNSRQGYTNQGSFLPGFGFKR